MNNQPWQNSNGSEQPLNLQAGYVQGQGVLPSQGFQMGFLPPGPPQGQTGLPGPPQGQTGPSTGGMAPFQQPSYVQPPTQGGLAPINSQQPQGFSQQPLAPQPQSSQNNFQTRSQFIPQTGGRIRTDTSQVPSPAKLSFPKCYEIKSFSTKNSNPPSDIYRYQVFDESNASPRFIRASLYKIPESESILKKTGIPMGLVVTPFGKVKKYDVPNVVPLVQDMKGKAPIRCNRCGSFVNPHVRFIDQGRRYICNMCGIKNDLPQWYVSPLNSANQRVDLQSRPELKYGTVDFFAPSEYQSEGRPPVPMTFVFLIDVSFSSSTRGVLASVIQAIKSLIPNIPESHYDCRIAFVTFSRTIQFYTATSHPKVMIVGDNEDPILPCPTSHLSIPIKKLVKNLDFIDRIFGTAQSTRENESCLGAAIMASQLLLENGGKIIAFATNFPSVGCGSYKPRDVYQFLKDSRDTALFSSNINFWGNLGKLCAKKAVSVNLHFFPAGNHLDTSVMSVVSETTNGHVHHYTKFNPEADTVRLYNDLERCMFVPTGYDAVLRVRCSPGLNVQKYNGNFFQQSEYEIDLANVDSETSFGVFLGYDDKITSTVSYAQVAMVYTTIYGQRMIRVSTLAIGVGNNVASTFKYSDLDGTLSLISREMAMRAYKNKDTLATIRDLIENRTVEILAKYKKYCSENQGTGQLVLPDSLKLLPVYLLGLSKSEALNSNDLVQMDLRSTLFRCLLKMNPQKLLTFCYPKMYPLLNNPDEFVDRLGNTVVFPPPLELTSSIIEQSNVYLLENGYRTYIWVGSTVESDIIEDLFTNAKSTAEIGNKTRLRRSGDSPLSKRVQSLLYVLKQNRLFNDRVQIFRADGPTHYVFYSSFVEDQTYSVSYPDFLVRLYKKIAVSVNN